MKKTPALAATLILIAATATACGANTTSGTSDAKAKTWFTENCPTQTTNIRESIVQGKPGGATLGTAIIQGPINPPAALDESTKKIGLYTQDKLTGQMNEQTQLKSTDTLCLDPQTRKDTTKRITNPETQQNYTYMRSPEYSEGIWVGVDMSELPEGFSVDEKLTEKCDLSWWPAMGITNFEGVGKSDAEIAKYALTTSNDC